MNVKIFLFIFLIIPAISFANFATISKMRGNVEILSIEQESGATPVIYKERKFFLKEASLGDKVGKGEVLRTGKASIARVIFENGDQFVIGAGSEYQLVKPSKSQGESSLIDLARGKFRAIISKDGPRNDMEVKTKTASMGVRGTDFFVKTPNYKSSEVSVLRGKVTISSEDKKREKRQVVKQGFSAEVNRKEISALREETRKLSEEIELEVKKASKQKILAIHKSTTIDEKKEKKEKINNTVKKEIRELEMKAIKNTLADIRAYDPGLYEEIRKEESASSADDLNSQVLAKAFEKAPEEEKLTAEEIENMENDPYSEYFDLNNL